VKLVSCWLVGYLISYLVISTNTTKTLHSTATSKPRMGTSAKVTSRVITETKPPLGSWHQTQHFNPVIIHKRIDRYNLTL
jgi:hypothetical protein